METNARPPAQARSARTGFLSPAIRVGWPCVMFLVLHAVAMLAAGRDTKLLSYLFMIAVALIAAGACLLRMSRRRVLQGWLELAVAMLLWAGGMTVNMCVVFLTGDASSNSGIGIFLYMMYGVPLIFAVASPAHEKWYIRAVDGGLALVLCAMFYAHAFTFASFIHIEADSTFDFLWLIDLENALIAIFALVRWCGAAEPVRRGFFGVLTLFAWAVMAMIFYNNHYRAAEEFGSVMDLLPDTPFLLLAAATLCRASGTTRRRRRVSSRFAAFVQAGSPLMLPLALLVVACILLFRATSFAVIGFIAATAGYGLRNVLAQMSGMAEQDRLAELSRTDALTGLANRRQFDETLDREWARARRSGGSIAVFVIDIDHFKLLNDGMGHLVGDERLRQVAGELAGCATRSEDFVGRFGGEEFVAILPGIGETAVEALAETMRKAVASRALPTPAPQGVVTVSIGVAWLERADADTPDGLVAAADAALYLAKQQGRNRVQRHPGVATAANDVAICVAS